LKHFSFPSDKCKTRKASTIRKSVVVKEENEKILVSCYGRKKTEKKKKER